MKKEITNKIINIVKKYCDVEEITLKTTLQGAEENSLDMDSLGIVSFIVDVEKEFDIIIDFDKYFECIEDVVDEVIKLNHKR